MEAERLTLCSGWCGEGDVAKGVESERERREREMREERERRENREQIRREKQSMRENEW